MSQPKRLPKLSVEDEGTKKNNNKSPRSRHLLKKFGITEDDYETLYSKQAGCCAICKQHSSTFKYKLAVDHDHVSRAIRGLLCYRCNKYVIGRNRKESGLDALRAAVQYLEADYTGHFVPLKIKTKKRRKKHARRKRI